MTDYSDLGKVTFTMDDDGRLHHGESDYVSEPLEEGKVRRMVVEWVVEDGKPVARPRMIDDDVD